MPPRIAAFPKCYMEAIAREHTMSVFEWIDMARTLDADGLEMYDGFLPSLDYDDVDRVGEAIQAAGFAMPMLCASPDFVQPSADQRRRAVDEHIRRIQAARRLGGPGVVCRVLSGQRRPDVPRAAGLDWVAECLLALLPVAREYQVVLGLENHYKDGHWKYPEFAQKADVFCELIDRIDDRRNFGVQYDPSNALVAGDDPVELLRRVADRVVSMHASDRYLVEGASLDDLRDEDGSIGYPDQLRHGVTGEGLNDWPQIFGILAGVGYSGWISIEDGMNGMDEMARSLAFLRQGIAGHWNEAAK